jgi:hypothetical protein
MQTPPPILTNGSGVEHEPVEGGTSGAGTGAGACGAGAGAPMASGESGGTHPPFTHTQFDAGLMLAQVLGAGGTGTLGTIGALGTGGGAAPPAASGCVAGTHPPLMHTHPGAGDGLRQALVGASVVGGGGVVPPAGSVAVVPVTKVKISDELVSPGLMSVA